MNNSHQPRVSPLRKTVAAALAGIAFALSLGTPFALAYQGSSPSVRLNPDALRLPSTANTFVETQATMELGGIQATEDLPATIVWTITPLKGQTSGSPVTIQCGASGAYFAISDTHIDPATTPCSTTFTTTVNTTGPQSVFIGANMEASIQLSAAFTTKDAGYTFTSADSHFTVSSTDGPTLPSIEGMAPDPLVTTVGHLTIRARDLLGYALRMKQELASSDTSNPIYTMYSKSRQVANVLFIIALVIIAFLYNFAILISRDRLRRLLILFVIAIIGVNFSYTISTIAVQGSDKLFNILLVRDDSGNAIDADIGGTQRVAVRGAQVTEEDLLTTKNFSYSGFLGAAKTEPVDATRTGDNLRDSSNNRFRENIYFNLALMVAGAVAQFLIVLILLARIVILWALIIVAPFFFLLAIFKFSQEIFKYWGWFFTRWLLIGPLLALFLSVCVRIWSSPSGVPISSSYEFANRYLFIPNIINIWVGAPGVRDVQGINLETPDQVMKYMMGLMMLYLAVLLPFYLTRRLSIHGGEGESLISKLLGGSKGKVKTDIRNELTPTEPKTPTLKKGFTFQDAVSASASARATTSASTGATTTASAASSARSAVGAHAAAAQAESVARTTTVAGAIGAPRLASLTASSASATSVAAEGIMRGVTRRLQEANVNVASLAAQAKPKAVARSMDEKVQAVARIAGKADVKAAELHALTQTELTELHDHLASLTSGRALGKDSALTRNLRAVEKESKERTQTAAEQREIRVKVQALAGRAEHTALGASDLSVLRSMELQALRSEIEARVAANPALKQNEALRVTYEALSAQIQTQSVNSIASIASAITAQTRAIVESLSSGREIPKGALSTLSVPELKEVSLSVHRLGRAVRGSVDSSTITSNLAVVQAALSSAASGGVDTAKVEALTNAARAQHLATDALASCTREELQKIASLLETAKDAEGSTGTTAAASQLVSTNLTAIATALGAMGADGRADGPLDSAKVDAALSRASEQALSLQDLKDLSRADLRALSDELQSTSALAGLLTAKAGVDPNRPEYKESMVIIRAEIQAREKQKEQGGDGTISGGRDNPSHLQALLSKITQNQVVRPEDLAVLSLSDLKSLHREASALADDRDGPTPPLDGDMLTQTLANITHEKDQRAKLKTSIQDGPPALLATALKKVRTNVVVAPSDLAVLGDRDLDWLRQKVEELLASVHAGTVLDGAVDTIQKELRARRLKELQMRAEQESPKVAELLTALISGAKIRRAVLTGLGLDALRLLADLAERAATLVGAERSQTTDFQSSLRTIETAFQRMSLDTIVRQVIDTSMAAQAVLGKVKAAEAVSAGELERLTLPEIEAVQAETFRLNLLAPPTVKTAPSYRDNLSLVSEVYEARVVEGKETASGGDGSARFVAVLREAVSTTLGQKIAELKAANKDDLATDLSAQQDDLGALLDRTSELASQRAEWIEYFRATPVPKVEGIANRRQWAEAEAKLAHAIYEEIASQDWVMQAKGIADAAGNLLMEDTTHMSPVQILTALAVKESAAAEALKLLPADDTAELVFVPVAEATAAAAATLRTFNDDDNEETRAKKVRDAVEGSTSSH